MAKKLKPSGGYRETASFQTTTIIYDATYWFCEKFLDPRSRMADQMVQAARSGRQNIAEGSRASATSSQTELRLLNVARSSLEELLLDYEDYLRQRHLLQWSPDSKDALANFLLDHQIAAIEKQFMEHGGYSEQLAAARLAERERKRNACIDRSDQPELTDQIPCCPKCGKAMVLRTVKSGKNAGKQFWGCSAYPHCKVIVEL